MGTGHPGLATGGRPSLRRGTVSGRGASSIFPAAVITAVFTNRRSGGVGAAASAGPVTVISPSAGIISAGRATRPRAVTRTAAGT